jgi:PknH-like protein
MRWIAAALALCLVMSGCADVVDGTAIPGETPGAAATTTTTMPTLVPTASLSSLPLKRSELADLVGDTDMTQDKDINSAMPEELVQLDPGECRSRALVGEEGLSLPSMQGVAGNIDRGAGGVGVTQLVAVFTNRNDAANAPEYALGMWKLCNDGEAFTVNLGDKGIQHWTVGTISGPKTRIETTFTRQDPPPRTCDHVMAAQANVVAEVIVCGNGDTAAQANAITDRILTKVPL